MSDDVEDGEVKTVVTIEDESGKLDEERYQPPKTSDACDIAIGIAHHDDIAGSLVVVLRKDGQLVIGAGWEDDGETAEVLGRLGRRFKEVIQEEFPASKTRSSTGVFAGDDERN